MSPPPPPPPPHKVFARPFEVDRSLSRLKPEPHSAHCEPAIRPNFLRKRPFFSITMCPKPVRKRCQPDPCADARSRWARGPRTASGILPRVAWCIRCLLPLLPQPSAALLSQMATHAVRPPFTGDPRHDDNIPFGGRGPLQGRRSRCVGNRDVLHANQAPAPL